MTSLTFEPKQCQVYLTAELLDKSAKQGQRPCSQRSLQTHLPSHYVPGRRCGDCSLKTLFIQNGGNSSLSILEASKTAKPSERESKLKTVADNARGHALHSSRQPEATAVKDIVESGAQSEQCVKTRASGTPESTQRGTTPTSCTYALNPRSAPSLRLSGHHPNVRNKRCY